MFDVSFGELLLVLIIGLIVLGPARLPEAIKTVASWIKALRRLSATVQLELNKELKLQELQDSLKQAEKSGLTDIAPEIQASIDELKRITESIQKEFYGAAKKIESVDQSDIDDKSLSEPVSTENNHHSVQQSVDIGKKKNVE